MKKYIVIYHSIKNIKCITILWYVLVVLFVHSTNKLATIFSCTLYRAFTLVGLGHVSLVFALDLLHCPCSCLPCVWCSNGIQTWTLHRKNKSCYVATLVLFFFSSSRSFNFSCCLPWSFSLSPWARAQVPLVAYFGLPLSPWIGAWTPHVAYFGPSLSLLELKLKFLLLPISSLLSLLELLLLIMLVFFSLSLNSCSSSCYSNPFLSLLKLFLLWGTFIK